MEGSPVALKIADGTVDLQRGLIQRGDLLHRLTTKERELLAYLVERAGQVVPREALLRDVWQYAPTVASRAPDSAVSRLRRKIELDPDAPRHLLTAHGGGYLWVGTDPPTDPPAPARGELEGVAAEQPIPIAGGAVDLARLRVVRDDVVYDLTATEVDLLRALRALDGRAADRRQLGRALGRDASGRWLDNAVARLRQKIEADPAHPRHLLTARGQGVRLEPLGIEGELVAVAVLAVPAAARLWAEVPEAMPEALELLRECTETALAHHGGVSMDTGNQARRLAFHQSGPAVRFAIELQQRLARQPWPEALLRAPAAPSGPQVAIAVHRGPREAALMVAEAMVAGAPGGELWVSSTAWDAVDARDPAWDFELREAGDGPLHVLRWADGPATAHGIPVYTTRFAGRERELAAIRAALAAPGAVVTLCGLGGMGKTRLAARVASELRAVRTGGTWWADLTEVRDEAGLVDAVAAALQLPGRAGASRIGDALAGRPGALLILDNAESVAPIAAMRIEEWRARARGVGFLVASRVSLELDGERVVAVGPLELSQGIALFAERARELLGAAGPEDPPEIVARLVERLDGIPLAIELAAARLDRSPARQILAELDAGPDRRDPLARALDWSWERLEPGDRAVVAAAAVFLGGGRPARLAATAGISVDALAPRIERLRTLGWLGISHPEGGARFAMYEVVRAHVLARLPSEELAGLRVAHARVHALLGDDLAQADRVDLDNLFAAAEVALAEPLPEVLGATATRAVAVARTSARARAALELAERAAAFHAIDPGDRARLLYGCSTLLYDVGEMRAALDAATEAIALAARTGDPEVRYLAAMMGCNAAADLQDRARFAELAGGAAEVADAHLDPDRALEARIYLASADHPTFGGEAAVEVAFELLARLRPRGPSVRLARTLNLAGGMSMDLGRPDEAIPLLREALEVYRSLGAIAPATALQANLGGALARVDPAAGREELESALERAREGGMAGLEFICQVELARIAEHQGRDSEALGRLDAAARVARSRARSVYAAAHRAAVLVRLGRVTEAATEAELAARSAEAVPDWEAAALAWAVAARARAASAPEVARAHLGASVRALEHARGPADDAVDALRLARQALDPRD